MWIPSGLIRCVVRFSPPFSEDPNPVNIRNVAIIAHVDHGKTTLVDALLSDAGVFREGSERVECVLDSNELERERGITVLSKNCAIKRGEMKLNIIDTPGHADFSGEVERVLKMADGALLLVDAFEGPMPQTRYVLRKALEVGHRVIVVINKCDKRNARPDAVLDEVFDLFAELGADDAQLDFPTVYASGRDGWVRKEPHGPETDTTVLFDAIETYVPAPSNDADGAFRMQVTSIDHSDYVGRVAIGRILRGKINDSMMLAVATADADGNVTRDGSGRVTGLFEFRGLDRVPITEASAGDIVVVQGFPDVRIGQTLCDTNVVEPVASIDIDEPTLTMELRVNDSPMAGREGQFVTGRQLGERLRRELRSNVALRVETTGGDSSFQVSGRGTLHLGILLETMRREGYEFAVGAPRVIDREVDGERYEPVEELTVDVPGEHAGKVIEILGRRRGEMVEMDTEGPTHRVVFRVPARGLIGLRTRLLTLTNGEAVMHHILIGYEPYKGAVPRRSAGSQASSHSGRVTAYALDALQDRGDFFVAPSDQVYVGQIVGEHCKSNDIVVNVTREKKLTNMRSSGTDRALKVTTPRLFSLEDALEYIADDELVEITPKSLRLRKKVLDETSRRRATKRDESPVA